MYSIYSRYKLVKILAAKSSCHPKTAGAFSSIMIAALPKVPAARMGGQEQNILVELVGAKPLHLAYARPFGHLKSPLGTSLLRKRELVGARPLHLLRKPFPLKSPTGAFVAAQTRACLGRHNRLIIPPAKKKQSVPDCWVSVKQFSRNDTATACQDWLRSTRLGRGSIKSHVRTVKVLGMGLFAYQGSVHLWQGVTH